MNLDFDGWDNVRGGWSAGLALLVVMALLLGCGMQSPALRTDELGLEVAQDWSQTKAARAGVDNQWLKRFGSRELERLVEQAVAGNRDLQVAATRLDLALQDAKVNRAAGRPTFSLGGDRTRQKQNFIGFPGPDGSIIAEIYTVSVDMNWEVDLWGAIRKGTEAIVAQYQAEALARQAAELSLAGQVTKAWLLVGETNEQIALAEENLAFRERAEEVARRRFEAALGDEGGGRTDVYLAMTDVEAARDELERQRQVRDRTLRQIELLQGGNSRGELNLVHRLPKLPGPAPAGLPSELLLRRPDVLAAERRFAATGRFLEQARLARYPSLRLTASGGGVSEGLGSVLNSEAGVWRLASGITQPIWEGGRIKAEQSRRQANEQAALLEFQQAVLQAFFDVEVTLAADEFFAKRAKSLGRAAELAEQAAEQAATGYARGTEDLLVLLEAERRRINLKSAYISLRRLQLENRVDLHLALGGDYRLRGN